MSWRILLLIGNEFYGRVVKYRLETQTDAQVIWYKSYTKFRDAGHDYSNINLGIVDYGMPDADEGEVLNFCYKKKIPIIVLANEITHDVQEKIWNLKAIDYILSGSSHSVDTIIDTTKRFINNSSTGILLVDNSNESRKHLKKCLSQHRYKIYEAVNGEMARELINNNLEKIQMVITDYLLTDMTGLELTENLRKSYHIDKLAIIGISDRGNHALKIQFIKSGANDFLTKPFISELLYCRIIQNLKIIEYFKQIKELAVIDQLTCLNNRHYLKETGQFLFENAKRHNLSIVAAMIDLDDFKKVNDNFGHAAGDFVLQKIAAILKNSIRKSDVAVRFGGEEFLIIANNLSAEIAESYFDKLRKKVAESPIDIGSKKIYVTISVGVCIENRENLEDIINIADKNLYIAKSKGKNRVYVNG